MSGLGRRAGGRLAVWTCVVLLPLAGVGSRLAGQTTGPTPSAHTGPGLPPELRWTEEAFAGVDRLGGQLQHMRLAPGAGSERLEAVLTEALAALDAADRRLSEQAGAPDTQPVAEPPLASAHRQLVAVRQCQSAILRGQLHYLAAAAIAPGDPRREDHLNRAVAIFRALRVDFRELPLSMMGYILESRAQRLAGSIDSALTVLETVLKMPVQTADRAAAELVRWATMEKLEAQLLADRALAAKEALRWKAQPSVKDEPAWQGRIDWLLARARLGDIEAASGTPAPAEEADLRACAGLLRDRAILAAAWPYDRLEALARLDRLAGGNLMTRQELLEWAQVQAQAGRPEATETFDRVLAMPGPALPADSLLTLARLFWDQGQWLRAADTSDRILGLLAPADARREAVLEFRAAALLRMREQGQALHPATGQRLLAALLAVLDSNLPQAARRESLVQWVAMSADRPPEQVLRVLDLHGELVGGSAYLLFCRAACGAALLEGAGRGTAAVTQPAELLRRIVADLEASRIQAAESNQASLQARAVLLHGQVISRPPAPDPRAALQVLNAHRAALQADPAVGREAAWLRVQLMMDLGMTEAAGKELAALPEDAGAGQAAVPLRLAEALAQRYGSADESARGRLRDQVLSLCNRAMSQAVSDGDTFLTVSRRSAQTMLAVGASSDAGRVLQDLLRQQAVRGDPNVRLPCSVMLAEALHAQGRTAQAATLFDELAANHPDSLLVHLARGRFQMTARQPDRAAESFRQARRLTKAGSGDWCRATLALARALAAEGHAAGASDILRLARVMYPQFGDAALRAELIQLQEELASRNTTGARSP